MHKSILLLGAATLTAALTACTTTPQIIYGEPTFNKYGAPSCRPANVPVGGIYTADLEICSYIRVIDGQQVVVDANGDPVPDPVDPGGDPATDPSGGTQNQNNNQNTNQNTNQANNQTNNQNKGG